MLQNTVNQCPHWACQQYGRSGGIQEWLDVERGLHPVAQRDIGEQQWVTGFQCFNCCRMVDSVPIRLTICSQYSRTICRHHRRMMYLLWGGKHSHGKTQYIPGKQVFVRS